MIFKKDGIGITLKVCLTTISFVIYAFILVAVLPYNIATGLVIISCIVFMILTYP
jgi:hypothetical protein